ncbi:MAG: VOC family protein [Bacteroidota bacterium]|nr:VOC family protein [Bacteroidota bacterium]
MLLHPYISFNGNAEEALNFYRDVFDGKIFMLNRYDKAPFPTEEKEKNKILHARLSFDGNVIMISDAMKEREVYASTNIQMSLQIEDADKMNAVFLKLSEGGTVLMPIAEQFWGSKFGMLKDKFGIDWLLNCELKKQ